MVRKKDQVIQSIKAYVHEISKDYRIDRAILFGSYASGIPDQESDIDLAIVSPDFKGKPEMKILQYLSRKAMLIDKSLEVVAFTPDELKSPDPRSFSYQVMTKGISIV